MLNIDLNVRRKGMTKSDQDLWDMLDDVMDNGGRLLVLTDDEVEAFKCLIQCIIFAQTKYYCTSAKEELSTSERIDYYHDIEKWWDVYDDLMNGTRAFSDYEVIKKIELDLSFEIFEVLMDEDLWCDNPTWLYNVMCVWKKFNEYLKENKDRQYTCCD